MAREGKPDIDFGRMEKGLRRRATAVENPFVDENETASRERRAAWEAGFYGPRIESHRTWTRSFIGSSLTSRIAIPTKDRRITTELWLPLRFCFVKQFKPRELVILIQWFI